tara:strand:+ start:305 stop:889 length:585 start_codon:yes stop_codon:yes gene_type:complete
MKIRKIIFIVIISILFYSCSKKNKIAPFGYFRIDLPEKNYEYYDFKNCNFSFELPEYLKVVRNNRNKCWINLENKNNNINIHLSYHMIDKNLDSLVQDVHNLVYEGHYRKADGIWETSNDESNFVIYELSGEVATPIQFYVTDRKKHFLRGSMYPITKNKIIKINRDSLKPVIDFYKKDIVKIIETIKWDSNYY